MPCYPAPDGWITRAQVWLGTLVEVSLPVAEATEPCFAAAFAAIAHVHRKMSVHEPTSDLARIAREAHRRAVVVDPDTYGVLKLAQALSRESGGVFDVTVAPVLARQGLLPARAAGNGVRCGRMQALRLEPSYRVRSALPVALDLGGIAKGYAVDRAVIALRAAGADAGLVNAGGDLRSFGFGVWTPVRLRHPRNPALAVSLLEVHDAAVATSADYFREGISALVDPCSRRLRAFGGSITVVAPTCVLADALTKVVALAPAQAANILARYRAHAVHLGVCGDGVRARTTCKAPTSYLRLPLACAA
jgi:thiamine biosynthesis lipoprotein